jgi:hypothetical protein
MKETDKAYIASFLDGEGSLGVYLCGGGRVGTRPLVSFYNNKIEVLNWINSRYKGFLCKKPKKPRHRNSYCLQIGSKKKCLKLLEDIYPYLILKIKQADLVIEYCKVQDHSCFSKRDQEILEEIKKLNMTGDNYALQ